LKKKQEEKQPLNAYVKYSSLAFQMIAIITIFSFIGVKVDENQEMSTPIYTAAFSLVGVIISFVIIFKSLK